MDIINKSESPTLQEALDIQQIRRLLKEDLFLGKTIGNWSIVQRIKGRINSGVYLLKCKCGRSETKLPGTRLLKPLPKTCRKCFWDVGGIYAIRCCCNQNPCANKDL